MTKFESGVKVVPASQEAVYEKLSDLSNLEKVKDRLPEDKVKNLSFDAESMTIEVAPAAPLCTVQRRRFLLYMRALSRGSFPYCQKWIAYSPAPRSKQKIE